jgi:two-component system sensor histidine kinase TctE
MRTPVAGISAQLELLISRNDVADHVEQLEIIRRGIDRLSRTANQLLSLARAEPLVPLPNVLQSVRLDALVHDLVERNFDRAEKARLDLGAELNAVTISGEPNLLDDLLSNLVDNALKYTPAGGHVTVRCGRQGTKPYLEVEDDGPGIPEAERMRVRERFYRRPGETGIGCGLGLAIVEEICRVHEASLIIEAGLSGKGTRARVLFPSQ